MKTLLFFLRAPASIARPHLASRLVQRAFIILAAVAAMTRGARIKMVATKFRACGLISARLFY